MHDHGKKEVVKAKRKYVLLGNPNVGKSVIFGILTGRYVIVSNYPGTTVEISQGSASFDRETLIIDTPGINNLIPMSEDEVVTRDILLDQDIDTVLQVADAKNLRRGLLITLQLAEMGIPFTLDLNMVDEARERGIHVDAKRLAEILGTKVIETIATQRKGVKALVEGVSEPKVSTFTPLYDPALEETAAEITAMLPETRISKKSLAMMLISGDESLAGWSSKHLDDETKEAIIKIRRDLEHRYNEPLTTVINNQRLRQVDGIVEEVLSRVSVEKRPATESLGRISMHPIYGMPVLLAVLFIMYLFVGVFGAGTLVNFFEGTIFGEYISPVAVDIFDRILPFPHTHTPTEINPFFYDVTGTLTSTQGIFMFIHDLMVGEYGMITVALSYSVAIVFPIVTTFFIAFGILEDSGYLPRLAVMVNRVFNKIGLNGKAVLPMVLGLGCATMATLTTRILETKKERVIVTLLLALGIPCSAQLGVILGMLGVLSWKATIIWSGVVVGVLFMVGYLASKLVEGDSASSFLIEIPPLRIPQFTNIIIKTLARIEWYLKEAVPLFILGTLVLFTLDRIEALAAIEKVAEPIVVGFLDLPPKATGAFLIGFLRRDYGAAGLFALATTGQLDAIQMVVSLVTITLFVPCIANFFMIVKERGMRTAMWMTAFIFPFAFLVGGVLNFTLRTLEVTL